MYISSPEIQVVWFGYIFYLSWGGGRLPYVLLSKYNLSQCLPVHDEGGKQGTGSAYVSLCPIPIHAQVKYGVRTPKFIWTPVYSRTQLLNGPALRPPPPPRILGSSYTRAPIGQLRMTTSPAYMYCTHLFQRLIGAPVETSAGQGGARGQQSEHEYDRPRPLQRPHNAAGPHLNHRTNHKVVFALLLVSSFYIFTRLYMSFSLVSLT